YGRKPLHEGRGGKNLSNIRQSPFLCYVLRRQRNGRTDGQGVLEQPSLALGRNRPAAPLYRKRGLSASTRKPIPCALRCAATQVEGRTEKPLQRGPAKHPV